VNNKEKIRVTIIQKLESRHITNLELFVNHISEIYKGLIEIKVIKTWIGLTFKEELKIWQETDIAIGTEGSISLGIIFMKKQSIFISLGVPMFIQGIGNLRSSLSEFLYPSLKYIKVFYYTKYKQEEVKSNGIDINFNYFKSIFNEALKYKKEGFKISFKY